MRGCLYFERESKKLKKVGKQILETRELAITYQVDLFSLEIISNHSQQNIQVWIFDF